jgi:hypothetical protein
MRRSGPTAHHERPFWKRQKARIRFLGRGLRIACIFPLALNGAQIVSRRLAAATVGDDLERNLLAFVQRAHTGPFDRANMNENIVAAFIRLDEAKTFLAVKPLNCAGLHEI